MSDYSEQIRSDLEKLIKILRKDIGGLFSYSEGSKSMSDYKEIIVKEYHNEKGLITRREIGEEIVRCKDCKWAEVHKRDNGVFCEYNECGFEKNDYCSYGEREDNE